MAEIGMQHTVCLKLLSGMISSDDQFPKLHSSAKLGKLSGSVCTQRVSLQKLLAGMHKLGMLG